jgi:hypothetical protein
MRGILEMEVARISTRHQQHFPDCVAVLKVAYLKDEVDFPFVLAFPTGEGRLHSSEVVVNVADGGEGDGGIDSVIGHVGLRKGINRVSLPANPFI